MNKDGGMPMYRGTTPTFRIKIKNVDLTSAKLYLTFGDSLNSPLTLTCPGDFEVEFDGTDTIGEVHLTQEQTFKLNPVQYSAQIRWVTDDEEAGATAKKKICVNDVLLKDVIHYE